MDLFNMLDKVASCLTRKRPAEQTFKMRGRHYVEHYRNGLFLAKYDVKNDITNEGKNTIFDVMFSDLTPVPAASWYIGLINITGYSALAATDVMNSHSGWTEFTTYSQANRVAWGPGNPVSQSISNSTPATFDITGTGTVKGIFITSNNTKGGTSGYLWSTALFSADVPVVNGDQLKITYTINA